MFFTTILHPLMYLVVRLFKPIKIEIMDGKILNNCIYVVNHSNGDDFPTVAQVMKHHFYILSAESSVLLFPEGGWNNSENILVQKLFSEAYYLSSDLRIPVVPISIFHECNSDTIYYRADDPIDLYKYNKSEANRVLRNVLATMLYEQIELYSTPINRNDLSGDIHFKYMEERKNEYLRVHWTRDVWDEELTTYKDRNITELTDVLSELDNVKITKSNAYILAPLLLLREENLRYDFKKYMRVNWNKTFNISD